MRRGVPRLDDSDCEPAVAAAPLGIGIGLGLRDSWKYDQCKQQQYCANDQDVHDM
jgi:hypothetical protein